MRLLGTFVLILALAAFALAQTQDVTVGSGSPDQGSVLEILEAHARTTQTSSERARTFTIVVKNTGDRVIRSVGFTFAIIDEGDAPKTENLQNPERYGFMVTDLDIQPDEVFTIERELSGNHCIPEVSVGQAVRVQELGYSDGSTWGRVIGDNFGWTQVKLLPIKSSDQ